MQLPCKEDMTPKSQMHGGKIRVAGSNGIIGCPEEFTIKLLAHNGYEYIYAPNIAHDGETPERTSYEEVLLLSRLRESVRRINPTIPPEIQNEAVKELNRS